MKRNILNIKGGKIEVYGFEPKTYSINLFRLTELKKIPKEQQILRRENTRGWFTPKKGVLYECDNYILRPFPSKKIEDHDEWLRIRRSYTNGFYKNDPVYQHGDIIALHPNQGMDRNYIQLTEDAYLEYLIEREMYGHEFLQDKNLDSLHELFKISKKPIMTIDIEQLEKICASKIIDEPFSEKISSIENESKVYQRLK